MGVKLFSPYSIKDVTLKNRIVMAPMGTNSSFTRDGVVSNWHLIHYGSRAVGQVGLIIVESTSVSPEGHSYDRELGIWSDKHKEGLQKLVETVHENGAKVGIQLGHAGGKSEMHDTAIAPSAIAYDGFVPKEMTTSDILNVINQYKEAARRAREVGFDVIEIHGAHGYLVNEFLSPLTNHRTDEYGGSIDKRYRFLEKIINAIQTEWHGPLFVRISADEYHKQGNTPETHAYYAKKMKAQGIDLIDCSSGGVVSASIDVYPGYQVPAAEFIRKEAAIATGAVGLITAGKQAEEILKNERADLIFVGRELLRNPYWAREAAIDLNTTIEAPVQYHGSYGATWFSIPR